MLLQYAHLPVAILVILAPQGSRSTTVEVERLDRRIQQDPATSRANSIVELVVLIAHKFFVEQSNPGECISAPGAEIDGVDNFGAIRIVKPCASDSKRRTGGQRNGFAESGAADGIHATTNIARVRLQKRVHTGLHVIRIDDRMAVHSDDNLSPGLAERGIQPRGDNATRIVYQPESRMVRLE